MCRSSSRTLFILLILAPIARLVDANAPKSPDRGALGQFIFLVVALAAVFRVSR